MDPCLYFKESPKKFIGKNAKWQEKNYAEVLNSFQMKET